MKRTVYLTGKTTGDEFYLAKFLKAQRALEDAGYIVLSPAMWPKGFTWEQYMRMDAAMLEACEAACFLPDWTESRSARIEHMLAELSGKEINYYAQWLEERGHAV